MKDIKNQREDTETESDTVQGMVPASARTPAFSGQRVPEGMQRAWLLEEVISGIWKKKKMHSKTFIYRYML